MKTQIENINDAVERPQPAILSNPDLGEYAAAARSRSPVAAIDTEAAAQFAVDPEPEPEQEQPKQESKPRAAKPAVEAPNFSSVASIMAPETMDPIREVERRGLVNLPCGLLRKEPDVARARAALAVKEKALELKRRNLESQGFAPGSARQKLEALDLAVSSVTDPAELAKFTQERARLMAITPQTENSGTVSVSRDHAPLVEEAIAIIDMCDAHLEAYLEAAIQAETAFLSGHGLPHAPTAVSQRIVALQQRARAARESLRGSDMLLNRFPVWTHSPLGVLSALLG